MGRAVGIELTEANVRILSLEQNGKRPRILQFYRAPIPGDAEKPWEERAAVALREALAASKIPKGRVVAALDSGEAILREVTLPFKNEDQIRKTVRFELESLVHNYTIEDLIVSYYKTGETDKATHLLAAAVPKEAVRRRLKVFQDAGVDPVALDLDVCAVFNAMVHAGGIDTDEPHLLIYGTTKFTKLVFIEQRQPRSIRTIRFALPAGAPAGAARKPETQVPAPQDPGQPEPFVIVTEEESRRFGDLDRDAQTELVQILAKEISRFLLANAASANPSHILLSGDFEDENAVRMIQEATGIPVRTFNLLDAIEHPFGKPDEETSRLGATVGLALKGLGQDALGMDFRQEEFQYRKKFEALKTTFLVTVELVIVFLAAVCLHFWFKNKDIRRDQGKVFDAQVELYEALATDKDPKIGKREEAFDRLKDLADQYKGMAAGDLPIKTSAREAWIALYRGMDAFQRRYSTQTLGEGEMRLDLETVDVQQSTSTGNESGTLTLRGKIRNLEFLSALTTELKNVELLKNIVQTGAATTTPDGMYQFQLKTTWGKAK